MTNPLDLALHVMRRTDFSASVAEVAAACSMSPIQLTRLFSAATGTGPKAYMTQARLAAAAASLVNDQKLSLVEVAFDAGFESQQTFTRAFTRWSGVSPGRYRKEGKLHQPRRTTPDNIPITLRSQRKLSRMGPIRVAGFAVTVGMGTASPSDAWAKLGPLLPVKGQDLGYSVGVCWSEAGADRFTYMAGVVMEPSAREPQDMEMRTIPAQTYAIVKQHFKPGPFAQQLRAGLKATWTERLPRMKVTPTGGPDFEIYPDDLIAGETAGWLEYWIPVED